VAKLVPVTLGSAFDDYFEASGPLTPGMELVIEGNERLRPGQEMRIVLASRDAPQPKAAAPSKAAINKSCGDHLGVIESFVRNPVKVIVGVILVRCSERSRFTECRCN